MTPDPRDRPPDPAGTRPKVDPESLLPARAGTVEGEAFEEAQEAPEAPQAPEAGEERAHAGPQLGDGPELLPEVREPAGSMAPSDGAPATPHTPRFQFLLGALLALGAVALAGALALAIGKGSTSDQISWSPWRPTSGDPVKAIATHVGREYRLPDGEQLVAVTGGPMEVAGLPLQIALRQPPSAGGDISLVSGKGVLYRLCGLGPKCAIATGKASQERHLLLRREALELALYTFRYVKDIDQVVIFMPPRLGQDPNQALLFRHGDVAPELTRPLRTTLAGRTPSVAGVATAPDSPFVNRVTTSALYTFSLTQANQDASVFLVLEPFAASVAAQPTTTTTTGTGTSAQGTSTSSSPLKAKPLTKNRPKAKSSSSATGASNSTGK